MGVVYGAGSLWQWRLHGQEPGFWEATQAPGLGWREALEFEGSSYVGLIGKILAALPLTDMQPNWTVAYATRSLLVPKQLFIAYMENGAPLHLWHDEEIPPLYRVVNAKTGEVLHRGKRAEVNNQLPGQPGTPTVVICTTE